VPLRTTWAGSRSRTCWRRPQAGSSSPRASAVVCALTAAITALYQTPSPALTAYVAFFLNRPDRAGSIVTAIALTIVVTVLLGVLVLVADAVVDAPAWRVGALAAFSFALLFLASASKLQPIAAIVALIVAYALDLLGGVPDGELAARGLLYAWLFVGIPAGVTIVVSLLAAPPPRRLAQRALALRLRTAAAVLRDPDGDAVNGLSRLLSQGDAQLEGWLHFAGVERSSPSADLAALGAATGASAALLSAVEFMARTAAATPPTATRASLARTLDDMALVFERGGYPVDVDASAAMQAATGTVAPLAAASLAAIGAAIGRFADAAPARAEKGTGFFVADAFTNPQHVRFAAKTTAAAVSCYLLYSVLDWPGIHTCLITCYIVSLSTVADSAEKLALRLVGCAIGALLGIGAMVFVVPSLTSIAGLLGMVFLGTLVGAWIAAGSPRIAYAGFQIAFAFLLCVVQGPAPAFDLTVARDRVIGIVIGNLVLYPISAHAWPVSVGQRIELGIAKALEHLGSMMRASDAAVRARLSMQARATLGSVQADLELARYEPASVRPSATWLTARHDVAARMAALEAPLEMIALQDSTASSDIARRLERMLEAPTAIGGSGAHDSSNPATLRGLVETGLHDLERDVQRFEWQKDHAHAPA
jgi:multidrug resistance protein MdtO